MSIKKVYIKPEFEIFELSTADIHTDSSADVTPPPDFNDGEMDWDD